MIIRRFLVVGFAALMLSGCGEELSADYLMRHPAELKSEADRCQVKSYNSTTSSSPYCAMVLKTISEFMKLVTEQEIEPEAFGHRVLKVQMETAKAKQALAEARKKADENQSVESQKSVAELDKIYQEKEQQAAVLLAVIGITSPG